MEIEIHGPAWLFQVDRLALLGAAVYERFHQVIAVGHVEGALSIRTWQARGRVENRIPRNSRLAIKGRSHNDITGRCRDRCRRSRHDRRIGVRYGWCYCQGCRRCYRGCRGRCQRRGLGRRNCRR